MSVTKWSIVLPVLLLTVTACHKRPPAIAGPTSQPAAITTPPAPPPPPRATPSAATPAATPLTEAQLFERMTLEQLNASRPLNDVFFDYNENLLREDARQVLQRDAQWLAKWPQTQIRIYGHCDERGTAEYNLALGDRRAVTVRDYLTSLGVSPQRIQTVSLGKESPFCTATGESCWSQNRRGHFVITGK